MRQWGRKLLAASIATLLAVTGLVAVQSSVAPAPSASAAVAKDFDPGDIISDAMFYNSRTMSVASIQAFLNAKVPRCTSGYVCLKDFRQTTFSRAADTQCAAYAGVSNESAASIIYKVSTACGINPQVILVTLQKEQGLVTNVYPSDFRYRSAMGYGCPDTAPCDTQYYGFYNQVYKAAWQFKVYQRYPSSFNFVAGRNNTIQWNPSSSCGSSSVYIRSQATAGLYNYTPYRPNQAALNNLYGVANDSCSSYGNRNFWVYFTDWFGSTHYTVASQLSALWAQTGGATGSLGYVTSKIVNYATGGVGQEFQKGWAYWGRSTGAFMTSGRIGLSYIALVGPSGVLGYPIAAQKPEPGGTLSQAFQKGSLYTTPRGGPHRVAQPILVRYLALGGPGGSLGLPTDSTNRAPNGGLMEPFAKGRIYWTADIGTIAIPSTITRAYDAAGGPAGSLGYPIVTTATAANGINTVQFENGTITWTTGKSPVVTMRPKLAAQRISGVDRYGTAVATSRAGFPARAPVVYVATGQLYPDALAAAAAASKQGGPLLLTRSTALPAEVSAEIKRLKPTKIVVVGGTGAVSSTVFRQLNSIAPSVRIGGADRYQTAANVVKYAFSSSSRVFLATGQDYPDALSASAVAGALDSPVLLVRGTETALPAATAAVLTSLKASRAYILGGTSVVSSGIAAQVAKVVPVTRYAGSDRYGTNQSINRSLVPTAAQVFVATGSDFPDALTGAALSGARTAPLYLTRKNCVPDGARIGISASGARSMALIGGAGVLGSGVATITRCG